MGTPLPELLTLLQTLAPLELAEEWDNVGLLLAPVDHGEIERILLTIDLTEPVLAEALAQKAQMVIAYHPPLFKGVRRLTRETAGERVLVDALRAGLFVYSPHTALDAADGGINHWLAGLVGSGAGRPIIPHPNAQGLGVGHRVELHEPITFEKALIAIKTGLGLIHARVAQADRHRQGEPIRSVAVCAGSGGSVFERVGPVDLLLTCEMRHHDVLVRVADGTSVILTEHSNSERGYLPHLAARMVQALPGLQVRVSQMDRDPLSME